MATQALILAAGRGSRLGPKSNGVPKPLLEVGRKTLIEHQLETLSEAGVGPIGVVVGYGADEVERAVGNQVEYLHNTRWASTNSLYSFSLARDWVGGDLVILNCDILIDPQILNRLLAQGGDCLAYDSSSGDGREHMKVRLDNGRVVGMSKSMDPSEADGENVGILCLTKETVGSLFEEAKELLEDHQEQAWVGAAVQRVAQKRSIRGVDIAGLPWGEIDFAYDLERARKEVWPEICRRAHRKRPVARVVRYSLLAAALVVTAILMSLFMTTRQAEWEVLSGLALAQSRIEVRNIAQDWYLMRAGEDVLETTIVGPAEIRVETRLILPNSPEDVHNYVVAIAQGDGPEEWHASSVTASGSAEHDAWKIAKRRRKTLEFGEGANALRVRLVAPTNGRCLIRIRQSVEDQPTGS